MRSRLVVSQAIVLDAAWPSVGYQPVTRYTMSMGDLTVGVIVLISSGSMRGYVAWSSIEPRFQGLGLGRKLYGEAARRAGHIYTDNHTRNVFGQVLNVDRANGERWITKT